MRRKLRAALLISLGGIALLSAVPGQSQPIAPMPVPSDVAAAYGRYHFKPIWFRAGPQDPASAQLISILQRAPFDGFAEGPQLAAQVQAAVTAAAANPAAMASAEQVLSSAWVRYVQALKRPTEGMIYAYPVLRPQGVQTDEILLTAAAAPSLSQYLTTTSNLNPVYQRLRDAGWANAQSAGNFTPDPRLLANLNRARSIPGRGRFVLVDSGSQILTMFDAAGQPADTMKVIVGTNELPTPLIASVMYYVTYNPYWHAPDHLVRKTIAPTYLKQGAGYLKSHGYRVIDQWSENPTVLDASTVDWKGAAAGTAHLFIRQDPGPLNSMGKLKFPFPNPEGIYLHDSPGKDLFAKARRNLSNGCVRLEDARRLGRWLIGQDPVAPSSTPELRTQFPQGVPVVLTYFTVQVKDGKLVYTDDFYGWDKTAPRFASAAAPVQSAP